MSDTITFESTDIPTEFPGVPDVSSDDPVCQYPGCGTALVYSGRGRKPKYCDEHKKASGSRSGSSRGSASVELAVQTLHGMYEGLALPLTMVSPAGAEEWYAQIPKLDERNRMFLASSPDLVKKINAAANKGGNFAFVFSHLLAIAPVVTVVRRDFAERAALREAQDSTQSEAEYSTVGGL